MKFIDLHCDTASRIFYENLNLKTNICSVDIEKLKKGESLAQVFAIFVDQNLKNTCYDEFNNIYCSLQKQILLNSNDLELVTNIRELEDVNRRGKIGAFISVEEGEVIDGDLEKLETIYNKGVRIFTITWNYKNKLGYPNKLIKYQKKGLTKKGIEVVRECENLGIILDVSHLSDGGFYDMIKVCKKPFIASHSNARAITNHPRNLSDDMIKLLSDKGGVMGLNFCYKFLGKSEIALIDEIVEHATHIRKVGGIDVLSLGSDFDGILNEVEIENVSEFYKLHDALRKRQFTENEIEKIFYKNAKRVFKEVLK